MRTRSFNFFAIILSAGLFAANLSAQTPTPPPFEDDSVIKVDSRLVVVPVSVIDAAGNPVQGLTTTDFRILEENRHQVIDHVGTAEALPLDIALLFDVSASTDSMFRFQQETAAKFLQEVMRADDRATIITVGEKAAIHADRQPTAAAVAALTSITPTKEQTAFYDSVRFAAEHLNSTIPAGRRKVIVVISDGEDTNSAGVLRAIWNAERKVTAGIQGAPLRELRVRARDTAKAQEQVRVLKALQDADTVFYSINPGGSSYQLNSMSRFGQDNMQKFADDTGGTAFLPQFAPIDTPVALNNSLNAKRNTEILERIFRQLTSELRAQYLVQYYSEAEYPDNRFIRLNVGLNGRPDLRVRARQGYYVRN